MAEGAREQQAIGWRVWSVLSHGLYRQSWAQSGWDGGSGPGGQGPIQGSEGAWEEKWAGREVSLVCELPGRGPLGQGDSPKAPGTGSTSLPGGDKSSVASVSLMIKWGCGPRGLLWNPLTLG